MKSFESKLYSLGIFVDLTKTFDHLNHRVLTSKLETSRVRGITASVITSYLQRRGQYVYHNNFSSNVAPINTVVRQCSILGPLPFIAYIIEHFSISKQAMFIIYVDDSSLFLTGSDPDEIIHAAKKY